MGEHSGVAGAPRTGRFRLRSPRPGPRALCNNGRAMRPEITTIVLGVLAIAFVIVAYLKDPGRQE